ncbi:MAG: AmmeMemoRadiSam system protein A [candidate division Zixibacteria bacterium]|nr:AmmeMemoRadiSam system protein A [candidate division Zixibacteria bacterium]
MQAAKRLGATDVTFLEYTTSGATTGDFTEVVGYLSAAITGERRAAGTSVYGARAARSHDLPLLSDEDKKFLLQVARTAIEAHLDDRRYAPVSTEGTDRRAGAFVTLTVDGELRGCIGQVRARTPLYQTVAEMAVAAATEDPRFDPLTRDEFERMHIEISVLSPLEIVRKPSDIRIGRDGLMIKLDDHSGLLLPQVATEHDWDVIQFLEQTCLKAGLPKHSHKDRSAEIYKFSAEVFS